MADPRRFITNTDYPMPFLVYSTTATRSVGGTTYSDYFSFAHGLPFTPLLIGQWSTNANFQPCYDIALEYPNFSGGQPPVAIVVGADDTSIHISLSNNTGSDVTFYFRLTAFAPPSYTGSVNSVDDNSPFKYNSDFNYMKIVEANEITVPANSARTINHGLGYIPQVRVWNRYEAYMGGATRTITTAMMTNLNENGLLGARVTDQILELGSYSTFGAVDRRFYYHIYADEV